MRDFYKKYAPDFCWVTSGDLFDMLNLYFPGCHIKRDCANVILCQLVSEGYFIKKVVRGFGRYKVKYLRVK